MPADIHLDLRDPRPVDLGARDGNRQRHEPLHHLEGQDVALDRLV